MNYRLLSPTKNKNEARSTSWCCFVFVFSSNHHSDSEQLCIFSLLFDYLIISIQIIAFIHTFVTIWNKTCLWKHVSIVHLAVVRLEFFSMQNFCWVAYHLYYCLSRTFRRPDLFGKYFQLRTWFLFNNCAKSIFVWKGFLFSFSRCHFDCSSVSISSLSFLQLLLLSMLHRHVIMFMSLTCCC